MKPQRLEFLSPEELDKIRACTLEILENTGIKVALKKMRDLLADHGCPVDGSSNIVKFPTDLVEASLKKAPSEFVICGADPSVQFPIGPGIRVWAGVGTACRMLALQNGGSTDAP
ncbi:MAG: trimethylamine methyltransferase family protein, partial [Deltaproteobacteria bacterium]